MSYGVINYFISRSINHFVDLLTFLNSTSIEKLFDLLIQLYLLSSWLFWSREVLHLFAFSFSLPSVCRYCKIGFSLPSFFRKYWMSFVFGIEKYKNCCVVWLCCSESLHKCGKVFTNVEKFRDTNSKCCFGKSLVKLVMPLFSTFTVGHFREVPSALK